MRSIILLPSEFSKYYRESGNEDFIKILGLTMKDYVLDLCNRVENELFDPKTGSISEEKSYLLLTDAVPSLDENQLIALLEHTEEERFYNVEGSLIAFVLRGDRLKDIDWDAEPAFEDVAEMLAVDLLEEGALLTKNAYIDVVHVEDLPSLSIANKEIRLMICDYWMEEGVRIDDPELVSIDPDCEIGAGTWIKGQVEILSNTVIGEDCLIEAGSKIVDSTLGDRVTVKSSLIESSIMEDGSDIGPYSHLRPKAHLKKGVHIGNFVEVKNAVLGEGTKAGHLAYIGDADVGDGVNIGCGVIFVNYDGKKKHRSSVGNGAFIGSNSNMVAPVVIEDEAYIAAGSTITRPVKQGELSIERAEQKNIEGYVERKKKLGLL